MSRGPIAVLSDIHGSVRVIEDRLPGRPKEESCATF